MNTTCGTDFLREHKYTYSSYFCGNFNRHKKLTMVLKAQIKEVAFFVM